MTQIEGDDIEYWQAAYDERAGFLQYDEGLPLLEAEALARLWIKERRGYLTGLKTQKLVPGAGLLV